MRTSNIDASKVSKIIAPAADVFKKSNGKCGDFWGSALNLYHHIPTLPETHMASEKWMGWKATFLLSRSIFRDYVAFKEGTPWKFNIATENIPSQKESSLPIIIFQGLWSVKKSTNPSLSGAWLLDEAFQKHGVSSSTSEKRSKET